tara:strand:- start:1510 stop:1665 length:156 start_codon:yes stop_codon:yes gene_type:complete
MHAIQLAERYSQKPERIPHEAAAMGQHACKPGSFDAEKKTSWISLMNTPFA